MHLLDAQFTPTGAISFITSFDGPQGQRILVLHEHAVAGNDRVGVGPAVRHLVTGHFLEFFAVRFENDQLSSRRKSKQHRAGIHDGTITAATAHAATAATAATSSSSATTTAGRTCRWRRCRPRRFAVLAAHAEKFIALGQAE